MNAFLIIVLVGLMALVLFSLVRGIVAFLKSTRDDIDRGGDPDGPSPMQARQNKMMMQRIMFQALAILVVVVLLAASGK